MKTVRTMPQTYSRKSKVAIARAVTSTPIKSSGLANLGYSSVQQAHITSILATI